MFVRFVALTNACRGDMLRPERSNVDFSSSSTITSIISPIGSESSSSIVSRLTRTLSSPPLSYHLSLRASSSSRTSITDSRPGRRYPKGPPLDGQSQAIGRVRWSHPATWIDNSKASGRIPPGRQAWAWLTRYCSIGGSSNPRPLRVAHRISRLFSDADRVSLRVPEADFAVNVGPPMCLTRT
jgi:hypothetical protein